jgi:hypothetical protein
MEAEGVVVKTLGRTSLLVGYLSRTTKSIGSETLNDSSKC